MNALLEAYLFAWLFWLGPALGATALLLVGVCAGGRWTAFLRPAVDGVLRAVPVWALLFVPVALSLPRLYPWAAPGGHAPNVYLTTPFFLARAALYFAVWAALPRFALRDGRRAGVGLALLIVTTTFAAIDWMMSLEAPWASTGYGLMALAGHAVSGLSAGILLLYLKRGPDATEAERREWHDLGTILLACVAVWAYLSFAQYLIVWSGNLPEGTSWYAKRSHGLWRWAAVSLALLHFAAPLLVLLSRQAKRRPEALAAVAGLLLVMRAVDVGWLVLPAFARGAQRAWTLDACVFLALGAAWAALARGRGGLRAG